MALQALVEYPQSMGEAIKDAKTVSASYVEIN
jgi:hypothetical protein